MSERRATGGTREDTPPRAGRRRSETSRAAILEAALAILEEEGLAAFNIEKVAARAKAAKTTIYRWWPTKGALAIDSFLCAVAPMIAFPEADTRVQSIRRQLHLVGRAFRGKSGRTLSMILAVAQSDQATREAYLEHYVHPRRRDALRVFQLAVEAGEFRRDADLEAAVDAVYGPIYYRLMVRHGPISDAWLDAVLDTVLKGLQPHGADGAARPLAPPPEAAGSTQTHGRPR